ncbi:MAG: hypothetical protein CEE38_08445 [Planctomycetes bacterium B3_Pla]|nr:MAG: hypothetical protein CEE38_08445 [Planctomycetes bacterium B3_Pla]
MAVNAPTFEEIEARAARPSFDEIQPKIGVIESVKEEFTRPAKGAQYVPILGGAVGAAENLLYLDAANRLSSGFDYSKPTSPAMAMPGAMGHKPARYRSRKQDEQLISDMILRLTDQQQRGYTFGGKVAKGVMQLPTWMAEFAMTGGLAKIGSKAVQEAGEKLIKGYAKTKAGQVALKTAGWAGGAVTRASLGLAPRVAEKATQRQVGVQILGADKEGWATSFAKAWGDVTIEAASETAGEAITGVPLSLVKKTKLGSKFYTGLRNTWIKATGGTTGQFLRKVASVGGYSNIVGEIGEERLGTILRAITDTEDFGAGKDSTVAERLAAGLKQDAKNIGVEAVVLSVPMAAQVAGGQVAAAMTQPRPPAFDSIKPTPARAIPQHPLGREKIDSIVAEIQEKGQTKKSHRAEQQQFAKSVEEMDAELAEIQRGEMKKERAKVMQQLIDKGAERKVIEAQRSAKRAGKPYFLKQSKSGTWRKTINEPESGDYYTVGQQGHVSFGKAPKLPDVSKPKGKGVTVTSGFDPKLGQFIAEDVKPAAKKAVEAAGKIKDVALAVPKLAMSILEPAKAAEKAAGKEAYAVTIRAIHKPEAKALEFDRAKLAAMDSNIGELKKWMSQFTKDEQLSFTVAYAGVAGSIEAEGIQQVAYNRLPAALKESQVEAAIREIAYRNHQYLKRVVGPNVGTVSDYFFGLWKDDPAKIDRFYREHYKTTRKMTKHKSIPSLADGINAGLTPRYENYIDNLNAEFMAIARLQSMIWLKKELMRTGKGKYIAEFADAPGDWVSVKDPVFSSVLMKPELAKLINSLISTNKISQSKVLSGIRGVNNFLRTLKFIFSAFHLRVIAKQDIADQGWLGFLRHPVKAAKSPIKRGFKKDDPIFQTPEYREYIELGGGHRYSIEVEAKDAFKKFADKLNSGNFLGASLRAARVPLYIPVEFVNWMFESYIPKIKYSKYLDVMARMQKKQGRELTDWQKINIIKETMNQMGEMNERLFGRSGTATSVLRFFFMSPGFAEGNYRTILKSLLQWGQGDGWKASRSRMNIVNSLLLTAIIKAVADLIITGEPPEEPETLEDYRDLFKIDTGRKDAKGKRIMIDLLDYDKDYWNVYFNVLQGRPDKAAYESLRRLGGMKAPLFEMFLDFAKMATGQAIYDWKGDRVTEITDSWTEKLLKLAIHEAKKTEPISVSVYKQAVKKSDSDKAIDKLIAFVEAVTGVRPTISEKDKRERAILRRCWSLKGQQEETYQSLATLRKPRAAVKWYNAKVLDVLDSKLVPDEIRKEWEPKLTIDLEKYLQNRAYQAAMNAQTKDSKEKVERAVKLLRNFGIDANEAEKLLRAYYAREKPERPAVSPLERHPVIGKTLRANRLKERMNAK